MATKIECQEIIQCACGCGVSLEKYDKWGRARKFISGHNTQGTKFPGRKWSDEHRTKVMASIKYGPDRHGWKGGRYIDSVGYVHIRKPDHPRASVNGYVFEHILVAEEKIGRTLRDDEVVHHINGVKYDNRPENLQVMTNSEHVKYHQSLLSVEQRTKKASYLVNYAKSIKKDRSIKGYCQCGCGGEFQLYDNKGRERKYLPGHNRTGKHWRWRKNAEQNRVA